MTETLQEMQPKQTTKKRNEPDWVGCQFFSYREGFRDLAPGFPPLVSRKFAIRKIAGDDIFFESITLRRIASLAVDRGLLQELRNEHKLLEDYVKKGVIVIYEPNRNATQSSRGLLVAFDEETAISIIENCPIDPPFAPIEAWSKGESRSPVLAAIEEKKAEITGRS